MKINKRAVDEVMSALGLDSRNSEDVIDSLKNKSEDELIAEIRRAKRNLQKNPEQYRRQIAAVKSMRGMFGEDKRKRLDMIIRVLEEK